MKTIKILHLFPKLLSLYGEYGNVVILTKTLENNGYSVDVREYENGFDIDFDVDFIYVGSGTEENLLEACVRLKNFREKIVASVENNTVWLVTGNAMSLFGESIKTDSDIKSAVSLFDYITEIEGENRFHGDVLTSENNIFGEKLIGYVNTSSVYTKINEPLLNLILGKKLGNDKKTLSDGIIYKNFYGTQFVGPFIVKNPAVLSRIYNDITGETLTLSEDLSIVKAYNTAVSELVNRII